jgi:hypothetical protein
VDNSTLMLITAAVFVVAVVWNQQKFKNQMLCTFIRPNRQKIEKWVPIYQQRVRFDNGRYGKGDYVIIPERIVMQWYDRGLSKMFPVLIPTLEFRWDSIYPIDPTTFETTWQSPELINANFQSNQQVAFAKGAQVQASGGKTGKYPQWLIPAVMIVIVVVMGYMIYKMQGQITGMYDYFNSLINSIGK